MSSKPWTDWYGKLTVSFLCDCLRSDQAFGPIDILMTQTQQRIQADACVIKHLKDSQPEPRWRDVAAFVRAVFISHQRLQLFARTFYGLTIDRFPRSLSLSCIQF